MDQDLVSGKVFFSGVNKHAISSCFEPNVRSNSPVAELKRLEYISCCVICGVLSVNRIEKLRAARLVKFGFPMT